MNRWPTVTLPITAAALMATAGAAVGHPAGNASGYEQERVLGYDVKYHYEGRAFRARMDRDPGRRGSDRCGGGRIINSRIGVVQARRNTRAPDLLII